MRRLSQDDSPGTVADLASSASPMARPALIWIWLGAGTMHFLRPRMYDAVIPPPFDRHARTVTYASGLAELIGGMAVAAGRHRFARWWLITLLAAVWPANIWMAMRPELVPHVPRWALYARLPLQFVFAWHVWRATDEPVDSAVEAC